MSEELVVASDGARIHVAQRGPPDGLPVLLVHGFPFTHRMWEPQLEALSDRFRLIAPDSRGCGGSDAGDGQYTMEQLVGDLFDVLDELGLADVVACGFSMGGYVVLRAVEREPDRFRAIVLCDTRSGADTNEGKIGRARGIETVRARGLDAFADGFLPLVLAPATLSDRPALVSRLREAVLANSPRGVVGLLLAMAGRTDTTAVLERLRRPALVVVGEHDGLTPPDVAREMAVRIPGAHLVVVPDAGHMSNLEKPEAFNAALRAFLEGLEAEAAQ